MDCSLSVLVFWCFGVLVLAVYDSRVGCEEVKMVGIDEVS